MPARKPGWLNAGFSMGNGPRKMPSTDCFSGVLTEGGSGGSKGGSKGGVTQGIFILLAFRAFWRGVWEPRDQSACSRPLSAEAEANFLFQLLCQYSESVVLVAWDALQLLELSALEG